MCKGLLGRGFPVEGRFFVVEHLDAQTHAQVELVLVIRADGKGIFSLITLFFDVFDLCYSFVLHEHSKVTCQRRVPFIVIRVDEVGIVSQAGQHPVQLVGFQRAALQCQYIQERGVGSAHNLPRFPVEIVQVVVIETETDAFPIKIWVVERNDKSQIAQLERRFCRVFAAGFRLGNIDERSETNFRFPEYADRCRVDGNGRDVSAEGGKGASHGAHACRAVVGGGTESHDVFKILRLRCEGKADAVETPIGYVPRPEDIDLTGLEDFDIEKLKTILDVDKKVWAKEAAEIEEHFKKFGDKLPQELRNQLDALKKAVAE